MEKLQAPFAPDEIEWRVGSTNQDKTKGLALAYVTNRAIQNRLDETFGVFGWKNDFKEWKGTSQLCGISVKQNDEWIAKWDGADDSNMEATKGGLSDAMKRAAYQWGIGRYLYKLPSVWCKIKAVGKSYALAETPNLPDWALPKEYKGTKTGNKSTGVEPGEQEGDKPGSTPFNAVEVAKKLFAYAVNKTTLDAEGYKMFRQDLVEARKIATVDDREWTEKDAKIVQAELLKLKK